MRSLILVLGLAWSGSALAGGMFHGVRCGLGDDLKSAVDQLNERMAQYEGLAGTRHSSPVVSVGTDGVLACVLVNRDDWLRPRPDAKSVVVCVSAPSAAEMARSTFGIRMDGPQGDELRDLSLTRGSDGSVTACALSAPVQAPPSPP